MTHWPALPFDEWRPTYATLHMWSQIVGKICLACMPPTNHFWNVALHVDDRGLRTPLMPHASGHFAMRLNLHDHVLEIRRTDGVQKTLALEPISVAEFYDRLMGQLRELGIDVRIWTMPVEVPDPIRFTKDEVHRHYNPAQAGEFWRALLAMAPVFETFRSEFIGKCSPVHFFWGSFDLAVTRFSGRPAPAQPDRDAMFREAYSHEVVSHGFWPGGGALPEPAFYAYAVPAPERFPSAAVSPSAAYYHQELGEFILPYEAVRTARDPERELLSFFRTTYDAAADLAAWDRASLERRPPRYFS